MARDYAKDLADYVTVNQRLEAFYKQWPAGSIESEIIQHTDKLVVVKARAYRWPNDTNPGIGHSSLEIPGTTPYTRGSELENAETSAWGRALAALGFEVKRGVASADEIANKHDPLDDTVNSNDLDAALPTPTAETRPSCPKCGNVVGFLRDKSGNGWFCWRKREGCGANFTDNEYENARTKPDDKDIEWDGPTLDTSTSQDGPTEAARAFTDGLLDGLAPTPTLAGKGSQKAAKSLLVSVEQVDQLLKSCESAGVAPDDVKQWFQVKDFAEMTIGQYGQALKELVSRRVKGIEL